MDYTALLSHVDHTVLKPEATREDIRRLCEEALEGKVASVCINPRYVEYAAELLGGALPVCTVVGFPLGATTTASKAFEAAEAVKHGAGEIDMVISVGDAREGRFDDIEAEIRAVKQAIGAVTLKVIVETCLLTDEQKSRLCDVVAAAGAEFIKTSTGFSTGGATLEDVALLVKGAAGRIKVKASGGIRTLADMERYLALGADRLGCSAAVKAVREAKQK